MITFRNIERQMATRQILPQGKSVTCVSVNRRLERSVAVSGTTWILKSCKNLTFLFLAEFR